MSLTNSNECCDHTLAVNSGGNSPPPAAPCEIVESESLFPCESPSVSSFASDANVGCDAGKTLNGVHDKPDAASDIEMLKENIRSKEEAFQKLQQKLNLLQAANSKLYIRYLNMKKLQKIANRDLKRCQEKNINSHIALQTRLRKDQIRGLTGRSTRGIKWSSASVREGLIYKMKMGTRAYSDFVKAYPIFPSIRSLQNEVKNCRFDSGIIDEVFDMMQCEVPCMPDPDKNCILVMDEIAIKEGEVYDTRLKKIIGKCTFPTHSGLARKALVFMLAGCSLRWKFPVAYYFTRKVDEELLEVENATGKAMQSIVLQILKKAEGIGLRVCCVISDMGSDNRGMWKAFGIKCTRSEVKVSISHPERSGDELIFMPDPVHAFKNIATMLNANNVISLPLDIVNSENLVTDKVNIAHLDDLMDHEKKFELKIAFRLKEKNLHCTNNFVKMKTSTSRAVFCRRTEVGLTLLSLHKEEETYRTTAYWVGLVNRWFDLMTNRGKKLALNLRNHEAYQAALDHIRRTAYVFQHMKVGELGRWKPVQAAVVMASTAILLLQDYFLQKRGYIFLLTWRFTQDCLENLFSLLRFRLPTPNALNLKDNLKVITLTQLCQQIKNSNYDFDLSEEEEERVRKDFLAFSKKMAATKLSTQEVNGLIEVSSIHVPLLSDERMHLIDEWEWPVIYDVAGTVIHSIKKMNMTVCDAYFQSVPWEGDGCHPYGHVVELRKYTENALYSVSDELFCAIMKAEVSFRETRNLLINVENYDIAKFMAEQLQYVWEGTNIPSCHDITKKILYRFYTMRLEMCTLKENADRAAIVKEYCFSSKTMAMHVAVQ
ncbi:uncharacterized protein [Temnothorax nylanderi]|uniref:uncharacterized protein n=1 Tax=Temnothorax nylanderi TaxID=102681 RepID=UPI003A85F60B